MTTTVKEELQKIKKVLAVMNNRLKDFDERIQVLENRHEQVEKKISTPLQTPGSYHVMGQATTPEVLTGKHVDVTQILQQNQGTFRR